MVVNMSSQSVVDVNCDTPHRASNLRSDQHGCDLERNIHFDCLFINSDLCRIHSGCKRIEHKIKEKAGNLILIKLGTITNRCRFQSKPCAIQLNRTVHH